MNSSPISVHLQPRLFTPAITLPCLVLRLPWEALKGPCGGSPRIGGVVPPTLGFDPPQPLTLDSKKKRPNLGSRPTIKMSRERFWGRDQTTAALQKKKYTLPYADPLKAGRHPFQTYMCACVFVSGLPVLGGQITASSVSAAVPPWMAYVWAAGLSGGAGAALVGSYWRRSSYDTALTIERIGLSIVGMTAMIYVALIAITVHNWGAVAAAGVVLGFGLSCLKRSHDIGRIFNRAIDIGNGQDRKTVMQEYETDKEVLFRRGDEPANIDISSKASDSGRHSESPAQMTDRHDREDQIETDAETMHRYDRDNKQQKDR